MKTRLAGGHTKTQSHSTTRNTQVKAGVLVRRWASLALLPAAFLISLAVVACQAGGERPVGNGMSPFRPTAVAAETVQLGARVYAEHCASCHGLNLEGESNWQEQNVDGSFRAPPHDASGHTWHHGDATLLEAIRLGGSRFEGLNIGGTSLMPAYEQVLSPVEIEATLAYIKSTWPTDIQTRQWQASQRESQGEGG